MKVLSKLFLASLLLLTTLVACERDNVDQINAGNPNYSPDTVNVNPYLKQMNTFSSDTIFISCIRIPFPVDFKRASGAVVTVNSSADLQAASSSADSLVDFVYPFQAVVNNNTTVINNIQDIALALISCDTSQVTCADLDAHVLLFFPALNIFTSNKYEYTINYPVTLIVGGQTVVLNNDSDYLPAIGGSPSSYPETELVYPITVNQFGQTIVLNDDQDVCDFNESLSEDCSKKPAHIQFFFNEGAGTVSSCTYLINFPVSINFNGTQQLIQTRNDYLNILNANANAYNGITLVYPVSATKFQNNQQLTFNAASDVCQYLDNCR
jgi:hypothetical protein